MNILLVNDDGFGAEGIVLVESILKDYGDVYVVAPKEHQSGKSCSIVLAKEYRYEKVDSHHYIVDGVPTSCTLFGLNALGIHFDLVVSGCNAGFNLTIDSMYSGTIGACMEALFERVPALALSCDFNFNMVKEKLPELLDYVFEKKLLSDQYLLNVNFPNGTLCKGIMLTSMYQTKPEYHFEKSENTYSYSRYGVFDNAPKGSDVFAATHDYISICPQSMTSYSEKALKELKKKI